jgi:hypothetical protein
VSEGPIGYTLPSGRAVTLRVPTVGDQEALRRQLLEQYKGEQGALSRVVYELGTLLPRAALTSDSGGKGLDPDPRYRCADWPISDMTAYLAFYDALTGTTPDEEAAAREAAKQFRAGRGGSV